MEIHRIRRNALTVSDRYYIIKNPFKNCYIGYSGFKIEGKMKFIGSGKVKDVYDMEDGTLLFKFSDRVSAYDVKFHDPIPYKGEVLTKFAEFWFGKLPVKNHFVKSLSKNEIIVKKMQMIPVECVIRGYFYGSLIGRWKAGEVQIPEGSQTEIAAKLPRPIFDPTTKSEHDEPINKQVALERNLVTKDEYDFLESKSLEIYDQMYKIADEAGFILADLKLEFGKLDGQITLGDSIGPDEYRMWPKETYAVGKIQESYDKQILRDWLTANGYQKQFEDARKNGQEPNAPTIPSEIINKMSSRYVDSYKLISGKSL